MTSSAETRQILVELVQWVREHSGDALVPLTYEELARRIGRFNKHNQPHAHGLGLALGKVGNLVQRHADGWGEPVPCLTSIVVQKTGANRGIPDDGIKEFWPDYPKLTREEKQNKSELEWAKIAEFGSRWDALLSVDELARINLFSDSAPAPVAPRGRGGESAAHRRLKEYVRDNAAVLGVVDVVTAICEYALPSLDEIDVLFKCADRWVAVEVKSCVSDGNETDYERGLYQVIKYHAILQGMRQDVRRTVPAEIRTLLVLQTRLPASLRSLASALQIEVIENISVPPAHDPPHHPAAA